MDQKVCDSIKISDAAKRLANKRRQFPCRSGGRFNRKWHTVSNREVSRHSSQHSQNNIYPMDYTPNFTQNYPQNQSEQPHKHNSHGCFLRGQGDHFNNRQLTAKAQFNTFRWVWLQAFSAIKSRTFSIFKCVLVNGIAHNSCFHS